MINYALIGRKLLHPTKAAILDAFGENRALKLSPNELTAMVGEPLGNVSYHVKDLAGLAKRSHFKDSPLLELVDTAPRRGAVEHFYALTDHALVGTDIDAVEGEGRR